MVDVDAVKVIDDNKWVGMRGQFAKICVYIRHGWITTFLAVRHILVFNIDNVVFVKHGY